MITEKEIVGILSGVVNDLTKQNKKPHKGLGDVSVKESGLRYKTETLGCFSWGERPAGVLEKASVEDLLDVESTASVLTGSQKEE